MISMKTLEKNVNRASKLKCICCGCKDKKIAFLKSKTFSCIVGFTTICCNCGHMHEFSIKDHDKEQEAFNINTMLKRDYIISEVRCGLTHKYCSNEKCPYWIECGHPVNHNILFSKSVYKPGYEEIKCNRHHNNKKIMTKNNQKIYL